MSNIKVKVPFSGFTPIDNIFIENFLCDIRGDFLKVYIICLKLGYSGNSSDIKYIADTLNLLESDVIKALESLETQDLIKLSPDGTIDILPIKDNPNNKNSISFDKRIKEMFDDIEILIGRFLSSKEVSTYLSFIEDFKFSHETVTLLVQYCVSRNKTDIRYIEKVALAWHDNGIRTIEDAQNYITKHEDKWNKYRQILNFIGIKDADIAKPQEEFLEKWLFTFNFPVNIILEACRICIVRINEANFSYIDGILSNWYKNGIKNLNDIKTLDKKPQVNKKANPNYFNNYSGQRVYDIEELEREFLGRGDINE